MGFFRGARDRPRANRAQGDRRGPSLRGLPGLGRAPVRDHGGEARPARSGRGQGRAAGARAGGRGAGRARPPGHPARLRQPPRRRPPACSGGASGGADAAAADQARRSAAARAGASPGSARGLGPAPHAPGGVGSPRPQAGQPDHGPPAAGDRPLAGPDGGAGQAAARLHRHERLHASRAVRAARGRRAGRGPLGPRRHALPRGGGAAPLQQAALQGRRGPAGGPLPPADRGAAALAAPGPARSCPTRSSPASRRTRPSGRPRASSPWRCSHWWRGCRASSCSAGAA